MRTAILCCILVAAVITACAIWSAASVAGDEPQAPAAASGNPLERAVKDREFLLASVREFAAKQADEANHKSAAFTGPTYVDSRTSDWAVFFVPEQPAKPQEASGKKTFDPAPGRPPADAKRVEWTDRRIVATKVIKYDCRVDAVATVSPVNNLDRPYAATVAAEVNITMRVGRAEDIKAIPEPPQGQKRWQARHGAEFYGISGRCDNLTFSPYGEPLTGEAPDPLVRQAVADMEKSAVVEKKVIVILKAYFDATVGQWEIDKAVREGGLPMPFAVPPAHSEDDVFPADRYKDPEPKKNENP